jgi:lipopolysaccharide/colanic/teichoic acid biosynthesis glycosyltransferase
MGVIIDVLVYGGLLAVALVGSIFSKLIADDVRCWLPILAQFLFRKAIQKLPAEEREIRQEEWQKDINDLPGDLGKFLLALQFNAAAMRMARDALSAELQIEPIRFWDIFKRSFDLAFSGVFLILYGPILLTVGLAIKVDDGGPVFFRQARVGMNNKVFHLLKFRTLRGHGNECAPTRLGRLLRLSRIDEIPQIINVIRGEMSLVGPRPERPEFVEQMLAQFPNAMRRHAVRPGLTGLQQTEDAYGSNVQDYTVKLKHDLDYVQNRAFWLDFLIIVRTVRIVLFERF